MKKVTFCRISEATRGLDVEDNRIADSQPDPEHIEPLSGRSHPSGIPVGIGDLAPS